MFKRYGHIIKKPMVATFKFSATSSLIIGVLALIIKFIAVVAGNIGIQEGAVDVMQAYFIALAVQLLLSYPWIFLYGSVRLFFESIFPKEQKKKQSELFQKATPVSKIQRRKEAVQTAVQKILEENKHLFDIEEIHLLERIEQDLLTKTENTYETLDEASKFAYEKEVLQSFDELEAKAIELAERANRKKEQQLEKQLHLIDKVTK